SWISSGRYEPPDDLARGLDARDPAHTAARLPVVPGRFSREVTPLEPPRRPERVDRAHEMLRPPVPQQPAGERAGFGTHPLHIGRPDHGERHARDALRQDDVVLAGFHNRALVVAVSGALAGGDEAGAE